MSAWKDRKKFGFKVYKDCYGSFIWQHGGVEWSHLGMTSREANLLRRKVIEVVRQNDDSLAAMRSR